MSTLTANVRAERRQPCGALKFSPSCKRTATNCGNGMSNRWRSLAPSRDEAVPDSDIDLLVDFDAPVGYFGLVQLERYLAELLGCRVDLGTFAMLRDYLRQPVERDLIRVAWIMADSRLARQRTVAPNTTAH
jgi:predicted nucleotidyltransferase